MANPFPLTITFDGASPEAQRTINFGPQTSWIRNEYNISVVDAGGVTVPGDVVGVVSVDVYSPGADRPETTANTLDLSTGARKFTMFLATINRAVFSVTSLQADAFIQVTAIRGPA